MARLGLVLLVATLLLGALPSASADKCVLTRGAGTSEHAGGGVCCGASLSVPPTPLGAPLLIATRARRATSPRATPRRRSVRTSARAQLARRLRRAARVS
jgi:hypothetical protein